MTYLIFNAMKRNVLLLYWSALCLITFCPGTINAKTRRWNSLFSLSQNFTIDKVKTTSKSTDVYFTFTAGTERRQKFIYISDFYRIIDIKGKDHPLLSVKGVRKGKTILKTGEKKRFRLSFAPLGANDSIFDIVTGQGPSDYFRFFGVHQESTNLPSFVSEAPPTANDKKLYQTPFDAKKKYTTCIMGHLDDPYKRIKQIDLEVPDPDDPYYRLYVADVDPNGFFELHLDIYTECLTYLHNTGLQTFIPVYLFPNDTLYCNVSNFRTPNQRCAYKSLHHDAPLNLLLSDPQYPSYDYVFEGTFTEEERVTIFKKARQEILPLFHYLSWKYQLCADEQELLCNNTRLRLEALILKHSRIDNVYVAPQDFDNLSKLSACQQFTHYIRNLAEEGLLHTVFPQLK